jgi:methanogenic corrinoid protein MtbC1
MAFSSTELMSAERAWDGEWAVPSRRRPLHRPAAAGSAFQGQDGLRGALLARVVEREVVPRLMATHSDGSDVLPGTGTALFDAGEIGAFAGLVLGRGTDAACSYVESLRARGVGLEALYLDLLAPTARRLGELWEEDGVDFTEVTVGLVRLMHVLHEVGAAFRDEAPAVMPKALGRHRRALLAPAPGDQHSFGLAIVSDFFRRAGWAVSAPSHPTRDDLARLVQRERFAVIGFSVSCERWIGAVTAAIRAVRAASCNPAINVMVGGPLFACHPELVAHVGADATATDARQAVHHADGLLAHPISQDD